MKKTTKYEGFLKVTEIEDVNKNGTPIKREIMSRATGGKSDDVVAGLLFDTEKKVYYFVKQYRAGVLPKDRYLIEAMAGTIDVGESPQESFEREAVEEVGFECNEVVTIGSLYTSPGGTTERVHLFFGAGTRTSEGGGLEEENEDIEILEYTKDELREVGISDMKTSYLINIFT
tara:strand:+ start:1782 stop:2303 length:522 start_codon:yes stop_codon:yes gene_type:complete